MKTKNIVVMQDEDANWTVIAGTDDIVEAEKALRVQEDEWFGPIEKRDPKSEIEKSMDINKFSAAEIYCGQRRGEESVYYWGNEPDDFFDRGGDGEVSYTREPGFIAVID